MSAHPNLDLDRYLERIGWGQSLRPAYDTLAGLLRAHMTRIPFENLDVLLGRGVRLDLEALQDKLVVRRRGGYCFEHATLFRAVLERLGFAVKAHSARVTIALPRTEMPRTHMFLTVALPEGTFVVDPGFGGLAPIAPVRIAGSEAEPAGSASGSHWLVRSDAWRVMRTRTADKLVDCWATTLEEDHPVDFTMANHFVSTHPSSAFVNRMMLQSRSAEGSISVMNREVTLRRGDVPAVTQLRDRAALRALLVEHFGFDLPEVGQLRVPAIPEWT